MAVGHQNVAQVCPDHPEILAASKIAVPWHSDGREAQAVSYGMGIPVVVSAVEDPVKGFAVGGHVFQFSVHLVYFLKMSVGIADYKKIHLLSASRFEIYMYSNTYFCGIIEERGDKMRKIIEEKYWKNGLTIFFSGAALIGFYLALVHIGELKDTVDTITGILRPFIVGFVMAYLLCPVYNTVTRRVYHRLDDHMDKKHAFKLAKVIGTLAALLTIFGVVTALAILLIPSLVDSIITLVQNMPQQVSSLISWINITLGETFNEKIASIISKTLSNSYEKLFSMFTTHVLPGLDKYVGRVSEGVILTVKTFLHILIGIIVSVYLLNGKEKFKAQATKIVNAFFSRANAKKIFEFGNFTNQTFGGFINGKIIDSIIIGILCYILMWIFGMPYPELCSTIVGVTNIIPFFGPFIGAIPTALIICVVSPVKAVEYLVLILVLQQFDGNILGPKILGDSTGLASFWVMFAIIVFGGLFGFAGMVVGVPVFAVFYYYMKKLVEKRLRRKELPEETEAYEDFNKYDINRKDIL
jgi:predicted PurR-regulated permease PerM